MRIRVAGQVDWKRHWLVVTAGPSETSSVASNGTPNAPRKRRMSALFSSSSTPKEVPRASLMLYAGPKPKEKKKVLLTLLGVKQAFAVYPERPELISRSTLMKLEGIIGQEEEAGMMKGKEGWLLVMPELEGGNSQASEMLKWLIGE